MIIGTKEYDILKVSKMKEMIQNLRYIKKNRTLYRIQVIWKEHKVVIRTWKWYWAC